jgi:hypothetical protein
MSLPSTAPDICDTEFRILCHIATEAPVTVIPLPRPDAGVPLVVAVDRFLDRFRDAPATGATYAETLARLRAVAGDLSPVAALTPELYAQTMARWDNAAAATFNKHLAALNSFATYVSPGMADHRPRPPPRAPQDHPPTRQGHPARPPRTARHRRPQRPPRTGALADALRDLRPR